MKTKVTELLQIEYPIIQGGMAWVADIIWRRQYLRQADLV